MRRLERTKSREEEEESVFVTMTDMTISFLLIIMILLAFFATQITDKDVSLPDVCATIPELDSITSIDETDLQNCFDELKKQILSLEKKLAASEAEVQKLSAENETLSANLKVLEDAQKTLLKKIVALRTAKKTLQTEVAELRATEEMLNKKVAELQASEEALIEKMAALQADRETLITKIAALRAAKNALQMKMERLEEKIDELEEQLERRQVVNPLQSYLSEANEQRLKVLSGLREGLLKVHPELEVVISPEQDALRFQGEGLFKSGSSVLYKRQSEIITTLGRLLDEMLVCFTLGERANRGPNCKSGRALIEAVQIEGHTDSDGTLEENLKLSTNRANSTLLKMLNEDRLLLEHQNLRGQPVMSVSAYGPMRPIETNDTIEGKAANRRIDLRIIMYAPSTEKEVENIGRRLDALRSSGG